MTEQPTAHALTEAEARAAICDVLGGIAPEGDLNTIDPAAPMQEALDLDSMNFLDLMAGIHDRTGINIPERDYPKVATLAGCIDYLCTHTGG